MYLSGKCPDFSAAYTFPWAPTAREIAEYAAAEEERTGAPFAPAYEAPPVGVAGEPLPPDQFCMCVLPPEAAPYVARPLQPLMDPSCAATADLYQGGVAWRADLVPRIVAAVSAVPREAYSAEEAAAVATSAVTVFSFRGGASAANTRVAPRRSARAARRAARRPPAAEAHRRAPRRSARASRPAAPRAAVAA